MKLKSWIQFEPGEKEKLFQLLEDNKDKSTGDKVELIKDTFKVSYGVAQVVLDKYPLLNK